MYFNVLYFNIFSAILHLKISPNCIKIRSLFLSMIEDSVSYIWVFGFFQSWNWTVATCIANAKCISLEILISL